VKTISSLEEIPSIPKPCTISKLQAAAAHCRACPLWQRGTQTVFGEGLPDATLVLVGEQPGNDEDLAGKPFVGPAGKLLDRALAEAGIERDKAYVTNAVKHFKWEARGKRRIHKKPNSREIAACRPWLDAELEVLKPRILICLGATAAQALIGRTFKVSQHHGEWVESNLADYVMATTHPSAVLRAPDENARHAQMETLVNDLRKAAQVISRRNPESKS
jgi:uracil-DNA glycosylase family protein